MTAPALLDLASEGVSSAPGTSTTISLSGTAQAGGYLKWTDAGAADQTVYRIRILDGTSQELAYATYNSSSNQFTSRTTLIASVNGTKQTTAINASANAVICADALAEDIITPAGTQSGFVNKFRNGTMDVWQRGTSITATTSGNYTADGWMVRSTGASVSVAQASGRKLTANSLKITGATSVTDVVFLQRIESTIAIGLKNQYAMVQAWIFNNTGATITPTLTVSYPVTKDTFSGSSFNIVSAASLQSCPNAQWTQVCYVFRDVNGNAGQGLEIDFDFGNNFSSNTKDVQIAELDIRAVPLVVTTGLNSAPYAAELRPYQIELALCSTYFQSTYGNTTAGGTSTTQGLQLASAAQTEITGGTYSAFAYFAYPAGPMRNQPTLSFWDRVGNSGDFSLYEPSGTWVDSNALGSPAITTFRGFALSVSTTATQVWEAIGVHYQASAEL